MCSAPYPRATVDGRRFFDGGCAGHGIRLSQPSRPQRLGARGTTGLKQAHRAVIPTTRLVGRHACFLFDCPELQDLADVCHQSSLPQSVHFVIDPTDSLEPTMIAYVSRRPDGSRHARHHNPTSSAIGSTHRRTACASTITT